ncbi:MAG: helix-turn-helix domain-containing protein [Clostridiales bacterium]|nr:helix-turn-helix domain-containing protein [Clostridiales bacterium]
MDIKEASRRLNISETTARRWIKSGRLQATMIDGPYGPQYEISEQAIERARKIENVPVLVHNDNPIITQDDIVKAIQEGIANQMAKVEQGILQEIDSLKSELEDTRKALAIGLEERDKKLIEVMRSILEHQREEYERREREKALPWWKKVFKK